MIPPCLTLSNISYVSRVKWSNPGKGVVPSPTPRCSSYWKRSLLVALDYGGQLYFLIIAVIIPRFKNQSTLLFTNSWRENCWMHTFPKGISAIWNADRLVQDFELGLVYIYIYIYIYILCVCVCVCVHVLYFPSLARKAGCFVFIQQKLYQT